MKFSGSVYGRIASRPAARLAGAALVACGLVASVPLGQAQPSGDLILEARDAFGRKDRERLAAARAAALATSHPLAMWVDYWELNNRLAEASQPELDAFYARWRDTYVEDRLRNDWLLELGLRRDFANFAVDYPRFRMNDDREVTCYALLTEHLSGRDVREAARAAWFEQREADDGCTLLAATLVDAKQFDSSDVWRKTRLSIDARRPQAARRAASLISLAAASQVQELVDSPARFLARSPSDGDRAAAELATLALARMADSDPEVAAAALADRWERALPPDLASWAWASVAKQAAIKLLPEAADHYQRAELLARKQATELAWPAETIAWKARAALRANDGKGRWQQLVQAVNAMEPGEQRDPTWMYWKARALHELARDSENGDALRAQAREMLTAIAGPLNFYGALAADALGRPLALPPRPKPLTPAERDAAAKHAGLVRALQLISLGLRNEGVREWNYSLRGMNDRELLAAAQYACDREVWDRCINTSERTRSEIDMAQRYPMPFRSELVAAAKETGVDPAFVFGLIRQESRFIADARSHVGASGLMQLMPATARWTARKIGLRYTPSLITERGTNLKLGTSYLKLVLESFDGSQALATAAYNAGPNRPRRWREGPWLEPAAWTENIPFGETRDYVKKVLANASVYSALMNGGAPEIAPRLGPRIGPRPPDVPEPEADLP